MLRATTSAYLNHGANGHRDSPTGFDVGGIENTFGFGRFYATGSVVLGVLDFGGAEGTDKTGQEGKSPAEALIDDFSVT